MSNEIIEGNKLIAEFMDEKSDKGYYFFSFLKDEFRTGFYSKNMEMNFHLLWNWLMPVVEKIESLSYRFTISTTFVRVHTCKKSWDDSDEYNTAAFDGKLKTTWYAVVDFIKWYNENKK